MITSVSFWDSADQSHLGIKCLFFTAFLDAHVFQFARFKDFAAFQAFHEFSIFITAYNLHARVLARLLFCILRLGGRL